MTKIEIYEMLLKLITEKAEAMHITEKELSKYYIPEGIALKQNYLERLASSLQNSGMMHNSIRFNESEERYFHIKNALYNFDCEKALEKYLSWRELYNALTDDGELDNGTQKDKDEKGTNWGKYAKGLYSGIEFLIKENGVETIHSLCDEPKTKEELEGKIKELKNIENRVFGLGFALTCDWLKECGCTWLAKPDIHIKTVCSAIDGRNGAEMMSDTDVIRFMYDLSDAVRDKHPDATAYKIDKIIWLICTGNFYLQKDRIGRDTILSLLKSLR